MDYLSKLENQSIYIMREAFNKFEDLAMLWSIGKDSTVLLWLARKAFFGHVPFPLVHVDTTYKIKSMIEYRDQLGDDQVERRHRQERTDLPSLRDAHVVGRESGNLEREVIRRQAAAQHIAQRERSAEVEIDHRIGADLRRGRQHIVTARCQERPRGIEAAKLWRCLQVCTPDCGQMVVALQKHVEQS